MFLQNKYARWYFNIIDKAKTRTISDYTESHHIVPKSLGGSNQKNNLVQLTAREHFVSHLLLVKMTDGVNKKKMSRGLWLMAKGGKNRYSPPSRSYETARKAFVESQKGHPNYLKSQTQASRDKISKSLSSVLQKMSLVDLSERTKKSWSSPESWTDERKQSISNALSGVPKSESHRKNIGIASSKHIGSLSDNERISVYGSFNKGKTWKLIDGKRVWFTKEN